MWPDQKEARNQAKAHMHSFLSPRSFTGYNRYRRRYNVMQPPVAGESLDAPTAPKACSGFKSSEKTVLAHLDGTFGLARTRGFRPTINRNSAS
jgi:hypothetical protein